MWKDSDKIIEIYNELNETEADVIKENEDGYKRTFAIPYLQ